MIHELSLTKAERNGFGGKEMFEKMNEIIELLNKLEIRMNKIEGVKK